MIPTGRPIRIQLRTVDVIHSFWIPKLAGKVDMIPNRANFLTNSPNNPSAVSTGQQNGPAFGKILYDVGPRIMQFAIKYAF